MTRWFLFRHVRYFYLLYRVNQHYNLWARLGYLPVNAHLDYAILDEVWRGNE